MKDEETIKGAMSMAQCFSLAFAHLEPSNIAGVPPWVYPATLMLVMLKILRMFKVTIAQCKLKEAFFTNKHQAFYMIDNVLTSMLKMYSICTHPLNEEGLQVRTNFSLLALTTISRDSLVFKEHFVSGMKVFCQEAMDSPTNSDQVSI
jgi:hypothetical protein